MRNLLAEVFGKGLKPLVCCLAGASCCAPTVILLALLLAACSPAVVTPSATPRPTSAFATVSGPVVRQTLPPTWTPSPTVTHSPTPTITPTSSPLPTQSAADICAGFVLLHDFSQRRQYGWGDYIPIFATLADRQSALYFKAAHRPSGDGTGFELPAGGQAVGVEFQIRALPRPGPYDWELGVRSQTHGDICVITGSFLALRPTPTPASSPTPEATDEPTPSGR